MGDNITTVPAVLGTPVAGVRKPSSRHGRAAASRTKVATKATARPRARRRIAAEPPPLRVQAPFERTTFGDQTPKTVDWKTRAALEEAERRLGYPLTIVQGSYNAGGVSQSAGTHDGGGVVDLLAWDWQRKVRVLRAIGFAAWYRPTIQGLWNAHIHAVMIDHGRLSPSAARQVAAYRAGRDGLKSNLVDPFWRPDPVPVFKYPPRQPPLTHVEPVSPDGGARGAFPPRRSLDGVDTSHHQGGRIDVKAAQAAGLRWWYLKTTEGTTVVDSSYQQRVRQARDAGIPVGAYHFARPDPGDAAEEATFFLQHSDIRAGDMLPMLDLESLEGMSLAAVTAWTGTWVTTVTRELARRGLVAKPIIYTPFDLGDGFGCLLWVARYSDDFRPPRIPKPWTKAAIWQHSDGRFGPIKHVPGFGPVDVNALHPDVPLSALRIRPARAAATPDGKPARPRPRRRTRPAPPVPGTSGRAQPSPTPSGPPGNDMAELRTHLQAAVTSLQAALDSLPER